MCNVIMIDIKPTVCFSTRWFKRLKKYSNKIKCGRLNGSYRETFKRGHKAIIAISFIGPH